MFVKPAWLVAFLALAFWAEASAGPSRWSDWEHGASGYRQAQAAAELSGDPLVVYFHTDWCPWCRKLNERYLRKYSVRSALANVRKVEVNPERGAAEKALFERYGGGGYPSLYVELPGSGQRPTKLSPFSGGKEQSLTAFTKSFQTAVTYQYNRWAHQLYGVGDYVKSERMIDKALASDSRNVYSNYFKGRLLHRRGYERRDWDITRQAKAAYERALAVDPNHKPSRDGLDALGDL